MLRASKSGAMSSVGVRHLGILRNGKEGVGCELGREFKMVWGTNECWIAAQKLQMTEEGSSYN